MKYLLLLTAGFCLHTVSRAQGCSVNYVSPSFQLRATNPGCNPNSGSIDVVGASDGVQPYTFRMLPSGPSNASGNFSGLAAGTYSVEMKDACGTIRTRQATLVPYQFSFSFAVTKVEDGHCHRVKVQVHTTDSTKVYQYGVYSTGDNDTTWSNAPDFVVDIGRTAVIVVKDVCGNVYTQPWTAPQAVYGYISELQHQLHCDKVDVFPVYYGFTDPNVCLYDFATKALIQCKSATGAYTGGPLTNFFNVPYGKTYYVIVQDACSRDSMFFPDMTSAGGSQIDPHNWDCTMFSMHVDGMEDTVCLYNAVTNQLISCKGQDTVHLNPRTGYPWPSGAVWDSLPYGSYYAWIYDPCTDSTFKIDSTVTYPFSFSSQLAGHCSITQSAVQAWFDPGAKQPFDIKVYYPDNSLAIDYVAHNAYSYVMYNTWPQPGTIKVIASDACNHKDTSYIQQPQIFPVKSVSVQGGCPGLYGPSGGGDIVLHGNHRAFATATVNIIKRDAADTLISKSYSSYSSGSDEDNFYFINLPTGRYVVESTVGCFALKLYDTVEIRPYAYPLQISDRIYQCGNNPYTFKDSTTNGVRPFTYEVVSTNPLYAPLLTGPQPGNVFNIPVGTNIDSVTIKVVDACFNSHTKTFPVQHMADCSTLATPAEKKTTAPAGNAVLVYPNPAKDAFTVSINRQKKTGYRIEVVNAAGIRVYEKNLYNVDRKNLTISEPFAAGLYLVKITDLQTKDTDVFKEIIN